MKNILTILNKELKRFFTDRRMVLGLILPGLLIFILYSLLGSFLSDAFNADENYKYSVYVANQPSAYATLADTDAYNIELKEFEDNQVGELLDSVKNKNIDLFVYFEKDFETKLANGEKPSIGIYYNSASNESSAIYMYYYNSLLSGAVDVNYRYYVNAAADNQYDLATKEDSSAKIVTMLMPYLLILLLFTGCMGICTEAIAGEKERGTIATLLVTPVKRRDIAIGKILALSITSLASSTASFVGLTASLPNFLGGTAGAITLDMYGFGTYACIFGLIVVTVILFTVLLSIISTFAKSVKEASQLAIPLMIIVMLLGLTSMMGMGKVADNPLLYLIPVYNSVQCMTGIFGLSFNGLYFMLTIISDAVYIAVGVYVMTKLFNSEKIMFNK